VGAGGGGGRGSDTGIPPHTYRHHIIKILTHINKSTKVKNMAEKKAERSCSQRLQETAAMMGMSNSEALNILKCGGVVSDNCLDLENVSGVDCERAMEYLMRYE